jgi:hypothetical protein
MSVGVLFAIGSVVFMLGGAALVLFGLDAAEGWRLRESDDGEEEHLEDQGTVGTVIERSVGDG